MKKLLNQRGFAAFEILILVLLLGVLGFVGYRYYQSNLNNSKGAESSATLNTKDDCEPKKCYEFIVGNVSFAYPKDWQISGFLDSGEIGLSGESTLIRLTSPAISGGSPQDYFLVEFRQVVTAECDGCRKLGANSKLIDTLQNGWKIYSGTGTYGTVAPKEELAVWMTNPNGTQGLSTGNGRYVQVEAIYAAAQADIEKTKLSNAQRIASDEYKELLEILRSVKVLEQ